MDNIKWIFFDMGYTIINEDPVHIRRMDAAIAELAEQSIVVSREEFWEEVMRQGSVGNTPIPNAVRRFGLKNFMQYTRDDEEAFPDAFDALSRLHKKYKLGIIANQPLGSADRLKKHNLLDFFDALFPSEETGFEKPDPEFYRFALRSVGCKPEEAVMVGDRPDNDILPAKTVGMRTIRILRGYYVRMPDIEKADITVSSLPEIADYFDC